ncbi:hypothetical protein [Psychromonas antarctica]|uniref:hypothetical protein n=1 Tax=Psychromonas antarctica TaxID=67573 RepID=UPI001EE99126|nr:hypothetical protein [Psychromonas antarctica]MCG6202450.1 hypothetical protein [Psychromonas antarctica]
MKLHLSATNMWLGMTPDIDSALVIDLIPVDCPLVSLNGGEQIPAAFSDIKSNTKLERLMALLEPLVEQQLAEKKIDFATTPVFWLLPELTIQDNTPLLEWGAALKKRFPSLFTHPKSQFFPFGRSAFAMSLSAMSVLFEQQMTKQVCVIALDSLYHELENLVATSACITAKSAAGLIPSEGAIMTCISAVAESEEGMRVLFNASERATQEQSTHAIDSLFYQVANTLNNNTLHAPISTFYAPGNGQTENVAPWLNAYVHLHPHIDKNTQLKQMAMLTGELGCVTGLFNFLHVYHAYQNQSLTGITLQLDVSERLYQAVNLYSWTGKD